MPHRFSDQELHALRNTLPIRAVIQNLLRLSCRDVDGHFRFTCPLCAGTDTGINQRINLSRCFSCARNFNTIDLTMLVRKLDFVSSVQLLQRYQARYQRPSRSAAALPPNPNVERPAGTFQSVRQILQSIAQNLPPTGGKGAAHV